MVLHGAHTGVSVSAHTGVSVFTQFMEDLDKVHEYFMGHRAALTAAHAAVTDALAKNAIPYLSSNAGYVLCLSYHAVTRVSTLYVARALWLRPLAELPVLLFLCEGLRAQQIS